ncbi:(2Fe-2S)-binding protein [Dermacoccus nishinomiyaensis]|uniref:(2Fe-2S)-binding protein n=1 Tax=Dermacoccus nishinomiyaensis TaxID=1274 RepID=UPI0013F489CA|nr:(2Fe-2S)-binding protein [Dermacoccus nishinomiyaensis]NHC32966.1 hypothetical protein [Dermacoccus nishinomiyaensis]
MPSPSASRVSEPDLGPFFRVDAMTPGADWRPLGADLASRGALGAWIDRARERTAAAGSLHSGDVDVRALCAVLHLGVCARVLSPWIASALRGTSPGRSTGADVPTLDQLFWQDDGTTTFPLALSPESLARLALATPVALAASDASVAVNASVDHFARALVDRLAIPLTSTALTPSASIAWGNVASALHGAARTVVRVDPGQSTAVRQIADACLTALTAARGRPLTDGRIGTGSFRRHSCCQLYRLPGNSRDTVCGDCVLRERTGAQHG